MLDIGEHRLCIEVRIGFTVLTVWVGFMVQPRTFALESTKKSQSACPGRLKEEIFLDVVGCLMKNGRGSSMWFFLVECSEPAGGVARHINHLARIK